MANLAKAPPGRAVAGVAGIPGDLLQAYTQVELEGLAAENPSGHPSKKQRREARLLAKERLEQEAKDGRFLRRRLVPVLWDGDSGELLFGSGSTGAVDRLHSLFKQTFDKRLEWMGAGARAIEIAEPLELAGKVDFAMPTTFARSHGDSLDVAWIPDETNRDFLGNELLLWLWHYSEHVSDTVCITTNNTLKEEEIVFMLANSMTLDCPRGQAGNETIRSDAPGKLPEAIRAAQAGKLPRKAGLTLVRHHKAYELTLQAETFAVGVKLPACEEGDEQARRCERVDLIREFFQTLDLLYEAFLRRRLTSAWAKEVAAIQKWLGVRETVAA